MTMIQKQHDGDMPITKMVSALLLCAVFLAALILPLTFINRIRGKMSPIENRYLTAFPEIATPDGFNKNFLPEFGRWFSDNIGFRYKFTTVNADVKVKLFNQSSGTVNIGNNGWFYYTLDDNLKLADGTYPLTEEHLAELAAHQQRIADNYALRGIDYYYIINPSKSTVYPEHIYDLSGKTFSVQRSPAEIAVDYLREHSTVKAMTPKAPLLVAKDHGKQVFLKTDTHYTKLGAYLAALATGEFMGIPMPPLLGVTEEQRKGEFSNMFGDPDILPLETAPVPAVDETYTYIDQNNAEQYGDFYVKLKELSARITQSGFCVYENPDAPGGTLLIYGDSQIQAGLGCYYYYYYSRVVILHMTNFTNGSLEIEALVKPNVVLRDLVERYIGSDWSLLPNAGSVVSFDITAQNMEVTEYLQRYYYEHHCGLYIDQPANDGVALNIPANSGVLEVIGWSLDPYARRELNALYIKCKNNQLIDVWNKHNEHAGPRIVYEDPLLPTGIGFQAKFTLDALENPNELVFVRIGAYGERLPDKVYTINYVESGTDE